MPPVLPTPFKIPQASLTNYARSTATASASAARLGGNINSHAWEMSLNEPARPSVRLSRWPCGGGSGVILLWTQLALQNCHAWLGLFGWAMPRASPQPPPPTFHQHFRCLRPDPARLGLIMPRNPLSRPASTKGRHWLCHALCRRDGYSEIFTHNEWGYAQIKV